MASTGGVRLEGLGRVVRDLQSIGASVDDLKDVFSDIAADAAQYAADAAPQRTGRLAASIRGSRAKNRAVVRAGGARVPYAGAINYGWASRGIAAAGFMQRADAKIRPTVIPRLDAAINALIRSKGLG